MLADTAGKNVHLNFNFNSIKIPLIVTTCIYQLCSNECNFPLAALHSIESLNLREMMGLIDLAGKKKPAKEESSRKSLGKSTTSIRVSNQRSNLRAIPWCAGQILPQPKFRSSSLWTEIEPKREMETFTPLCWRRVRSSERGGELSDRA